MKQKRTKEGKDITKFFELMEADNKKNKPLYKYMARTWRAFSATTFLVHKIPVTVYDSVFKIVGYYTGSIIKP